jgi:hypothetical protein
LAPESEGLASLITAFGSSGGVPALGVGGRSRPVALPLADAPLPAAAGDRRSPLREALM